MDWMAAAWLCTVATLAMCYVRIFIYLLPSQSSVSPVRGYNIMRLLRNDAQTINKSIFLKHNNGAHGIKSFQILTANDLVIRHTEHTHTHTTEESKIEKVK